MARALLDCVCLPESEIPVKALLWLTVAAVTVCSCHGREVRCDRPDTIQVPGRGNEDHRVGERRKTMTLKWEAPWSPSRDRVR